jgi:hypothetical protein
MLDPEFAAQLQDMTDDLQDQEHEIDMLKWRIANSVNEMWSEHASAFRGDKMAYYAECSRVANDGHAVRVFGESGETLRRWCEVAMTYENVPQVEEFLTALSFAHLAACKKLAKDGKIPAPDFGLAMCVQEGLSSDDLLERYADHQPPHAYDKVKAYLEFMTDKNNFEFIKNADKRDEIVFHANVIRGIILRELEKEGKAE